MDEIISETIEEIEEEMKDNGREVAWIGSFDGEYAITLEEFKELGPITYDSGIGVSEIAKDLVVVFTDGCWMERFEYDGSECWDFKECPQIQENPKKFTNLKGDTINLRNINKEDNNNEMS